jgi:hypothetical protein
LPGFALKKAGICAKIGHFGPIFGPFLDVMRDASNEPARSRSHPLLNYESRNCGENLVPGHRPIPRSGLSRFPRSRGRPALDLLHVPANIFENGVASTA